jgi:two-component system, NtrC family, response regulator GlrR
MIPVSYKILVVDDDTDILRLLTMRLQTAGYEVQSATSAEQALALAATNKPHLVVTDLRMGGMNGLALFDTLHQDNPGLPVIILTAHGSIPDAVEATQRGVFGFLTKPFDSKDLLKQVADALRIAQPEIGKTASEDDAWRVEFVTRSPNIESMLQQAKMAAISDASILIRGESGTGKEMLARAIHRASPRRNKPFVAINCGAVPESLLESELFGHAKGAFTGATRDHKGLFQAADGGTLFLDEIGDMPLPIQVKMLRVLQERTVRPVGSTQNIPVDVRIIAATHRNLAEMMEDGRFREDLYYRLNVVTLELPALSARREDIPLLATHFLTVNAQRYGKQVHGFAPEAMELLVSAPWPGNIRQLQNIIEQAVVLCTTPLITTSLLQKGLNWRRAADGIAPFDEARRNFERDYLARLLKATNGSVTQAARLAQRNRTEFYKLLDRHQLTPSLFKTEE